MKKKWLFLLLIAITLVFTGCPELTGLLDKDTEETLTELINKDSSDVDLQNAVIDENVTINVAKKISNADFSGKTITIPTSGVVLDNIKNANIVVTDAVSRNVSRSVGNKSITIQNCPNIISIDIKVQVTIAIEDSEVESLTINAANSSVVLKDETLISGLKVVAEGASLKAITSTTSTKVPQIEALTVSATVSNVDIAGGSIEAITVETSSTATTKPSITLTGSVEIERIVEKDETGKTSAGSVIVSDEIKEEVTLPEDVVLVTISSVTLKKTDEVIRTYEIGDDFDFTGLSVEITYSDNSKKEIALTKANTTISGFNTTTEGTCKVHFVYNGYELSSGINVTVVASTKAYKILLDEGIDLLFEGSFDEGIAKIRSAYEKEKNDETKLYYALAELATISTSENVASLLKNHFGIVNYPATMNALLNGEWLKDYVETDYVDTILLEEATYGSYVRVDGDEYLEGDPVIYLVDPRAYLDEDGDWIYNYDIELYNISLNENGKYLMYRYDLESLGITIPEGTTLYRWNWDDYKCVNAGSVSAPEFALPSWFEGTKYYEESLFGSVESTNTLLWLLLTNLTDCNPTGLNEMLDSILAIFAGNFETAKQLTSELSHASVYVPAKVIDVFGLEEIFGDSGLKIGKAEMNVLIAAMEIVQGTFEWIASYDFSADITQLKYLFSDSFYEYEDADAEGEKSLEMIKNITSKDILEVRDASLMDDSKNSFVDALNLIENSYNYLVSADSYYPQAAIDEIKEYGDVLLEGLQDLRTCINEETVFFIPEDIENGWKSLNNIFAVDMGKFFTPGYFSNFFEKDANGIVPYFVVEIDSFDEVGNWLGSETIGEIKVTSEMTYADVQTAAEKVATDSGAEDFYTYLTFKLQYSLLKDLCPGCFDDLEDTAFMSF